MQHVPPPPPSPQSSEWWSWWNSISNISHVCVWKTQCNVDNDLQGQCWSQGEADPSQLNASKGLLIKQPQKNKNLRALRFGTYLNSLQAVRKRVKQKLETTITVTRKCRLRKCTENEIDLFYDVKNNKIKRVTSSILSLEWPFILKNKIK